MPGCRRCQLVQWMRSRTDAACDPHMIQLVCVHGCISVGSVWFVQVRQSMGGGTARCSNGHYRLQQAVPGADRLSCVQREEERGAFAPHTGSIFRAQRGRRNAKPPETGCRGWEYVSVPRLVVFSLNSVRPCARSAPHCRLRVWTAGPCSARHIAALAPGPPQRIYRPFVVFGWHCVALLAAERTVPRALLCVFAPLQPLSPFRWCRWQCPDSTCVTQEGPYVAL